MADEVKYVTPWGRGRPSKEKIALREKELAMGYVMPPEKEKAPKPAAAAAEKAPAAQSDTPKAPKRFRRTKVEMEAERPVYAMPSHERPPITDPATIHTTIENYRMFSEWLEQGKVKPGAFAFAEIEYMRIPEELRNI